MATLELPIETYDGPVDPDWCPACGDFGVLKALKQAAGSLGIRPDDMLVVSGIGCSSNLPGFIHAYGVHGLHGRAVPLATGAHLANTDLTVVITGGDGDGYGIGLGHMLHAMRRNLNLTYVVMNNQVYGLTTGQASPTTGLEVVTKSTPRGNPELPLNPLAMALAAGCGYVARGFSGDVAQMAGLIAGGMRHRGFALVDVFSPCVTYNHLNTYPYFRERVYKLEEAGHDPADLAAAMRAAGESERLPTGLFYQVERPSYADREPALADGPPVKRPIKGNGDAFRSLIAAMC
ncbi:MAG: 2-oxoacid:ferredoxin oxidoreductase subunit beta [Nitrospirae bacterium]|nr:2-oxoacid:ferredoxin oxidoreductase subunit beta [Nitrospirota bacterium]